MSKLTRKLAAIVFTDIVGFTELSAKNEPAALELLNKQRKILKPIVEEHGGDWLKEIGDGLLLTFNTNREAVLSSIAIQEAAKSIPELTLRIGIHQGEVVFQGEDVVGDDVNIASRIEPFSASGGIALSGVVNSSLERDPEFETTFIGKPALKGVSQEIKVYCITSHGLPRAGMMPTDEKLEPVRKSFFKKYVFPITGGLLVLLGGIFWFLLPLLTIGSAVDIPDYEKRIAVLYLENRGKQEDSYFSDGLTEEIITRLSRVDKISVVSRFNVAEYKGKNINLDDIRDNLEADYLLTGNVMKLDEKIKISVELVDLEKQDVEWSTSFEKDMSDIFLIQDEIAINIVENLDITIGSQDKELVLADPTTNVDAYKELLKIRSLNTSSIQTTIELLNTILENDSTYADALGMRSLNRAASMFYDGFNFSNEKISQANNDAEKALLYDPLNLIALVALPTAYLAQVLNSTNTSSKIIAARKALVSINNLKKLHPDHHLVDVTMGFYYFFKLQNTITMSSSDYETGKKHLVKAIKELEKVINIDPMAIGAYQGMLRIGVDLETKHSSFSNAIYYGDELANLLENENNMPELVNCYWESFDAKKMVGDYENVINQIFNMQRLAKQLPQNSYREFDANSTLALCYEELGQAELGMDIINQIDTTKKFWDWKKAQYYKRSALVYARFGNQKKATEYMKISYDIWKAIYEERDFYWITLSDIFNLLNGDLMFSQSYLAKYFAEQNDITSAMKYINELEEMLSNTSGILTFVAIDIYYNLALAHKGLNNEKAYNKYLNIAFNEITKISNRLDDEHKQTYLNNVRVNREVISMKNNS